MSGSELCCHKSRSVFIWRLGVIALVLLAFVVRLYWARQPRVVWGDEPFYIWLGQSLLSGQGYQFFGISAVHHSPLLALLSAGILRLIPPSLLAGQPTDLAIGTTAVYVIAGTLLVLPMTGIARRLVGDRVALVAGLLTALYPAFTTAPLLWGTMTEPIYVLMVTVAWWGLLVALEEGFLWSYLVVGLALGLAYLTRSEAIVYVIVGLAAIWCLRVLAAQNRRLRSLAWLVKSLAGPALMVLAFSVTISPYLIGLRAITGHWLLFEEAGSTYVSAQGLAYGQTELFDVGTWGLDQATGEVYYFSSTSESQGFLDAIVADPVEFKQRVVTNVREFVVEFFGASLVPWPFAALAVLGLFVRPWNARRLRGEILLAIVCVGPASFILFFIQERYLVSALIPVLEWTAAGAAALGDWLTGTLEECLPAGSAQMRGWRWARHLAGFLPVFLLALALVWQQPRLWRTLQLTNSFQSGHIAAAQSLRSSGVTAETTVMSRYPAIAFHAGCRWAPTPAAPWPEVATYAERRGADYLVIDAWEAHLRPQLAFLLDPAAAPAPLRYLTTVDAGAGPVLIYEFIRESGIGEDVYG